MYLLKIFILMHLLLLFADDSTILYIGDSHSVNPHMYNSIKDLFGKNINYYASCGSNAGHWIKGGYKSPCGNVNSNPTASFATLKNQRQNWQDIIINLGDNHFTWSGKNPRVVTGISTSAINDMVKLAQQAHDKAPCTWVGPTWGSVGKNYYKEDKYVDMLYKTLKERVSKYCRIIDCRNAVPKTSPGDGLHHSSKQSSQLWANCIKQKIDSSRTPEQIQNAIQ